MSDMNSASPMIISLKNSNEASNNASLLFSVPVPLCYPYGSQFVPMGSNTCVPQSFCYSVMICSCSCIKISFSVAIRLKPDTTAKAVAMLLTATSSEGLVASNWLA